MADEPAVFAVRYCLQTIGECAKRVSEDVKAELADVPWKRMAGTRDRLAHGYLTVQDAVLYTTVVQDLPSLTQALDAWLASRLEPHP